jgi:hypothetical protein
MSFPTFAGKLFFSCEIKYYEMEYFAFNKEDYSASDFKDIPRFHQYMWVELDIDNNQVHSSEGFISSDDDHLMVEDTYVFWSQDVPAYKRTYNLDRITGFLEISLEDKNSRDEQYRNYLCKIVDKIF